MSTPEPVTQALAVANRAVTSGNRTVVAVHATSVLALDDLGRALTSRLDVRDERGDIEARTVTIAIMAALALAVGAIIRQRVTAKAETITLD